MSRERVTEEYAHVHTFGEIYDREGTYKGPIPHLAVEDSLSLFGLVAHDPDIN